MPLSFIERPRRSAFDRVILVVWWIAFVAFAVMVAQPLRFGLLRLLLVGTGAMVYVGAAFLLRRNRFVLAASFALPAALALFLSRPGKPGDAEHLRARYTRALESLEGTVYVWGGETRTGIDCSGLVRGAFTDATLSEGLATANPALLRNAASLWWHDESAKALGEHDRGLTQTIAIVKSLNNAPYESLRPGDIAVLESGVHTLAYLGGKTWIQADPKAMRVVRTVAPTMTDGWFVQPVRLLRWTPFTAPPQVAHAD